MEAVGREPIYRKGVLVKDKRVNASSRRFVLDASESGSSKLVVRNQSNNDVHGYVVSDIGLLTAIIGFDAVIAVYIHIGVGFGVARSTTRAMPEPRCVGRVTEDSHASFMYSHQ